MCSKPLHELPGIELPPKDAGTKVVHTAIQAPNMNTVAERFVGSVKHECLRKLILFGDRHLQRALSITPLIIIRSGRIKVSATT